MAEDIYHRVFANIREDPETTTLDTRLFEEAQLILPNYLTGTQELYDNRLLLMRNLAADLMDTRRQDHTPVVNLLMKLFDGWTWQQVCDFGTSSIPYKDGLAAGEGMVAFNKLMLCLLEKATRSSVDAAHAGGMLETMRALVMLWLSTENSGVAEQAGHVLYDLLKVDLPGETVRSGGQGLVWKRVFGDKDVYNVFFETTSLEKGLVSLSKNQKTIAQARLMDWLPKVGALDWSAVSRSHHVVVEERYLGKGKWSLLDYVALHMVDYKDDVLMHRCLIDFYSGLLRATKKMDTHTMAQHDSVGLQYMIMHGLHARTAAIYLQQQQVDPVDAMFLYGPAANYLAIYAEEYSKHYLAGQMPTQVNERLLQTLDLTPGKWAHAESPKNDLHLLASLPRKALLPFTSSPVALLPSKATNADVLNTLASIFHGPERQAITFPPQSPLSNGSGSEQDAEEAAAARAVYFSYLANNQRFWQDVTTHADTVALIDLALAAINCLTAVITANWSAKAEQPLPSSSIATPEIGHLAILSPPALEYTLPYLLKPAQTFANLVGGRGDSESAAYKIALAKFDALRALNSRLMTQVEQKPGEGYEEILATISKRLAEGPMTREGQVGGAVGTLEL